MYKKIGFFLVFSLFSHNEGNHYFFTAEYQLNHMLQANLISSSFAKSETSNEVLKLSQLSTSEGRSELINDSVIQQPREPGQFTEMERIEGIDHDKDGIRDDVEIWIFNRFPNPKDILKRRSLLQLARSYQKSLVYSNDETKSIQATRQLMESLFCASSIFGPATQEVKDDLKTIILNSKIRIDAWEQSTLNFGGQLVSIPESSKFSAYCNFEIH